MKRSGRTVVIKLGTSSIVSEGDHQPLLATVSVIVETVVHLRNLNHNVIIVSSGAIGHALRLTKRDRRPKHLPEIQALAAIGQCKLMAIWDQLFGLFGVVVGQVLLTRNDIALRSGYQNAQNTINQLLTMDVVPIVNENDTLSVAEIKFGDNDTLSAITAGMVAADYLFLMTDVDCVYDKNPRYNSDAVPIEVVEDISALVTDTTGGGSHLGTGGMATKIVAARLATAAGVTTVITRSSKPGNIPAIILHAEAQRSDSASAEDSDEHHQEVNGGAARSTAVESLSASKELPPKYKELVPLHTRFLPDPHPIRDRYFWILHGLQARGILYIDQGAAAALSSKAGLLPVGIVDVEGSFHQQEAVKIIVVDRLPGHTKPSNPSPRRSGDDFKPEQHVLNDEVKSSARIAPDTVSSDKFKKDDFGYAHAQAHYPASGAQHVKSQRGHEDDTSLDNHTPNLTGKSRPATPIAMTPLKFDKSKGIEIGRALVNYSASEIRRIKGQRSNNIAQILGYADNDYVALRENIAFIRTDFHWPLGPGLEHWS